MKRTQTVKIPTHSGAISYKVIKTTTYVYLEKSRTYSKEKKYSIPRRICIGKLAADNVNRDEIIPNEKFYTEFPDLKPTPNRCPALSAGAYAVFKKIIKSYNLEQMLEETIGKDNVGLFLDLAMFYIICEDNASQHYPFYAMRHPLFTQDMHIYSDSSVSRAIKEFGEKGVAYNFLCKWNKTRDKKEKIWVSYDSTNKNSSSSNIGLLEYGNAKDDNGCPIFNWSVAYDIKNSEPLFYEEYLGSIVDVSQLQIMLDKADSFGYSDVGFILDRGYFSKENIRFMDERNHSFLIMTKGLNKNIRRYVESVKGTFETDRSCYISVCNTYGVKVKGKLYPEDTRERNLFIYWKIDKCSFERKIFEKNLERMAAELSKLKGKVVSDLPSEVGRYFEIVTDKENCLAAFKEKSEAVKEVLELCGYYVIASSEDLSAEEALMIYKGRDYEEKLFRMDKSFLGSSSMRTSSDESLDGRLFIEFVALILRNKYYRCLKAKFKEKASTPDWATVPASIEKLEQIWMSKQADGIYRQDAAITKTQKEILAAFGISEGDMKQAIKEVSTILQER